MSTWIIFAIFGAVVIIMIAIAVTGTKKDKKKRRLTSLERTEKFSNSQEELDTLIIKLGILLEWTSGNANLLKSKNSPSKYTISDINSKSEEKFNSLLNDDTIQKIYKVDQNKNFIKPILNKLKKTKPSNWETKDYFEFNIIIAKYDSLKKQEPELTKKISNEFKI